MLCLKGFHVIELKIQMYTRPASKNIDDSIRFIGLIRHEILGHLTWLQYTGSQSVSPPFTSACAVMAGQPNVEIKCTLNVEIHVSVVGSFIYL